MTDAARMRPAISPARSSPIMRPTAGGRRSAALNGFVLSELLGRKDVRLYDGSMTDWTPDANRPVETC